MSAAGEAEVAAGPATTLMAAGALADAPVHGSDGARIGRVAEVMIEAGTGAIAYVVLATGGVLGVGERLHAVPWGSVTIDPENARLSLGVTRAALDAAPGFDKDAWPADADHDRFPAA